MIACHASRLASPFSSLDHLLGLQNGTAHAVSATFIIPSHSCPGATAQAVSMLFHAPSTNTLLKPWDLGGTSSPALRHKKIQLRVLPHSVDLLLHHGLSRSAGGWSWAACVAEGPDHPHAPVKFGPWIEALGRLELDCVRPWAWSGQAGWLRESFTSGGPRLSATSRSSTNLVYRFMSGISLCLASINLACTTETPQHRNVVCLGASSQRLYQVTGNL